MGPRRRRPAPARADPGQHPHPRPARQPQLRCGRSCGTGAGLLRRRRPVAAGQGSPPARPPGRDRRRHVLVGPRGPDRRQGDPARGRRRRAALRRPAPHPAHGGLHGHRHGARRGLLGRHRAHGRAHPRRLRRGLRVDAAGHPPPAGPGDPRTAAADALDRALPLPGPVARLGGRPRPDPRAAPRLQPRAARPRPHRGPDRRGHRRPGAPSRGAPPGGPHLERRSWREPRGLIALAVVAGVPAGKVSAALNRRGRGI